MLLFSKKCIIIKIKTVPLFECLTFSVQNDVSAEFDTVDAQVTYSM